MEDDVFVKFYRWLNSTPSLSEEQLQKHQERKEVMREAGKDILTNLLKVIILFSIAVALTTWTVMNLLTLLAL